MASMRIDQSSSVGGRVVSNSKTYSAALYTSLEESAPGETTDTEIILALDVSETKAFYMVSTVDATVETNNSAGTDDVIVLVAGVPYVWTTDSYDSFLLTVDVTKIFVSVVGVPAATIRIEAVSDPTP